jgi:hypothetical protein
MVKWACLALRDLLSFRLTYSVYPGASVPEAAVAAAREIEIEKGLIDEGRYLAGQA